MRCIVPCSIVSDVLGQCTVDLMSCCAILTWQAINCSLPASSGSPKKPVGGAFGLFVADKREELMKECNGKMPRMMMQASALYRELGDVARKELDARFLQAKERYEGDMRVFQAVARGTGKLTITKANVSDLRLLKVPELRVELHKLGLSARGHKQKLVQRLADAAATKAADTEPNDGIDQPVRDEPCCSGSEGDMETPPVKAKRRMSDVLTSPDVVWCLRLALSR